MSGFHFLDFLAIFAYLAIVLYLGRRASHQSKNEEGYFLAGRKLGKAYQLLSKGGIGVWELVGIFLISIVQIHGIIGNMGVAGSATNEFSARFFYDGIFPFIVLILVSLISRAPSKDRTDQFFGKMKTPVGATPELDVVAMNETRANPNRFNNLKLFPRSSWEFTKWDKVDAVGFVICVGVSFAILSVFWTLLRLASS